MLLPIFIEAREQIKKEKANGKDFATRLKAAKRITAGFFGKKTLIILGQ